MSESGILEAICDDDQFQVRRLLRADPALARHRVAKSKLFLWKIIHWLYAGDTPLHLAAAGYRVEIVRLLLESGADPNASANHRRSGPLHYAADTALRNPSWTARKQVKTIRCLLEAGADIDAQDKNGAAPLHRAVRTRGSAAVHFLLEAGANPILRNKPGSTPFHLAVQNTGRSGSGTEAAKAAQEEIIRLFLSLGISPLTRDARGKTVFESTRSETARELLSSR